MRFEGRREAEDDNCEKRMGRGRRAFQRADIQDMEQDVLRKGEGGRLGVTVNTASC